MVAVRIMTAERAMRSDAMSADLRIQHVRPDIRVIAALASADFVL
jgi:hypothetical protein